MIIRKAFIILVTLSAFACAGKPPQTPTIAPVTANVAASPVTTQSRPPVKTFKGRGKVTKIILEPGSVELDHEEIKGAMPAMIMEFVVKDKDELKVLKVGDKVDFVLEDDFGQERIIGIKKAK